MDQNQIVAGRPVAVIGAGVSGLVAAKRLAAEGFQVDVYERRSQAGGLWNFSPDPNAPFASAVYEDLQTNFPRQLMELQDYPWTTQPLFMQHNVVQKYLEEYASDMRKKYKSQIRFNFHTEVVRLFHESQAGRYWELTWTSLLTRKKVTRRYRYVVVAVGVYDETFIPYYEGLSTWRKTWKGSISHAKAYRNPDVFSGKNVLIVGYQASGFDIAKKIAASVSKLWISSTREPADELPCNAVFMRGVSRFFTDQRRVTFTDGRAISEVDHIIFCTGYQYHQPFIKMNSTTDEPLFPTGPIIDGLHEHTICDKPTLAFIGMVRGAVPTFLLVQAQAAFVSRFFSGQFQALLRRKEDPQHRLPFPLFVDYLLRLESLCQKSDNGRTWIVSQCTNPVFRWTVELELLRVRRREIRGAFQLQLIPPNKVWSITDTIHECHCRFLAMSVQNIKALGPFLILCYGYKDDFVLPFQGWEPSLRPIFRDSISGWRRTLSQSLGQESDRVLKRGSERLYSLVLDRWVRLLGVDLDKVFGEADAM